MAQSVSTEIKLLSRHSSVYGLATLLNRIVAFILLPVYTRYLSPADYGILDLLYLTCAYIGMVMDMGIISAMSRFYFDSDDQKERNLVISTTFYGFGVGSTIILLIFMAGSSLLSNLVFHEPEYTGLMILALITLGLDMFNRIGYTYLRVKQRSFTLLVVSISGLLLTIALNVIFLVVYDMGVRAMLWGTIIAYIIQVSFLMPYTLRETGMRFSWSRLKELIRFGIPLMPSEILAYIVNTSDRYFLNSMHNLTMTGLYSLGYRFGVLINRFVVNPFNQIWTPRRFEKFEKDNAEQIYSRIFTYFCLACCFAGLLISVLAKELIQIITEKSFWDAHLVVPILVLSYIVASFRMHFSIGIMMKKKTKYILYINIIAAALNLILNYFLIRSYGMYGAAWATLLTFVVKSYLTYYYGNRVAKIFVETGRLTKLFVLAMVLYWPLSIIETGHPILNLAVKSVACLIYPVILYLIGLFEPSEIAKAREFTGKALSKAAGWFRRKKPAS